MNRKHTAASVVLGRDVFSITVFPQVDYVFIAALVAILDDVHRDRKEFVLLRIFWMIFLRSHRSMYIKVQVCPIKKSLWTSILLRIDCNSMVI